MAPLLDEFRNWCMMEEAERMKIVLNSILGQAQVKYESPL